MFRKLIRKYNYLRLRSMNSIIENKENEYSSIPSDIEEVKKIILNILSECSDLIIREFIIGSKGEVKVILVYLDGLVKKELIDSAIIQPLLKKINEDLLNVDLCDVITEKILSIGNVNKIDDINKSIESILSGLGLLFINGCKKAIVVDVTEYKTRKIEEPTVEVVVRGPREGFTENIKDNITMLRRKIRNPNLKFESLKIGEKSNTEVIICYLKGTASEAILYKVKKRLLQIKIDAILESGYIEEFIEDSPYSMFPTVGNTEKPDRAAAKIMEGRVVILCDGTPVALTVPYLFVETLQISEDYYSRYIFSSFLRILRMFALAISILGPALYIALVTFHHDLIPFRLMMNITSSRKPVPFHPFIEAFGMTIVFELIREAGTRMPKPVGQSISIVGALVLGQAAVEAGLVGSLMIIVIAVTSLTSFITPPLNGTVPLLRIVFMIGANFLGLLGVFIIGKMILVHMCMLKSFDVPYMYPYTPLSKVGLKDAIFRFPFWSKKKKQNKVITDNIIETSD